jgi:hypothetical protein
VVGGTWSLTRPKGFAVVTSVAVSPSSIGHDAMSLGKQRTVGAWTVLISGLLLLLAAQLHHWIAPHDSDGAAGEILPVVVSGALGWLVVFGAALIAPHRASDAARTRRRSRRSGSLAG